MHHTRRRFWGWSAAGLALIAMALLAAPQLGWSWNDADFAHSPLVAYPLPTGRNDIIGTLESYTIRKGDTLLDVARWFNVSAAAVSNANNHMDWWAPPVGKTIVLPTEHILPYGPHSGIVVNVPELRLYYYPAQRRPRGRGKLMHARYGGGRVVYTFPVGLGRFDWRTPIGKTFRVTAKEHNPPWIVPNDIYREHLERDGYAVHMVPGGSPDNPEGHWRLDLNMPEYAIHGTNDPWGVGMEVSHGCIRLYPEAIDRLWHMVPVGTKGHIVYQPVKYGWRGNALYVEVHEDLYGLYPGLWRYALREAKERHLLPYIDTLKLEKAVEEKTGIPTYVMPGPKPPSVPIPATIASSMPLPPPGSVASAPDADTSAGYHEASAALPASHAPTAPGSIAPASGELPPTALAPSSKATSNTRFSARAVAANHEDSIDGTGPSAAGAGATSAPTAPAPSSAETHGWERVPAGAMPIE
jgi:L,D-transpeptidase ErfK/SrfK